MIGTVIKNEVKAMVRDKMTLFFLFFPVILAVLFHFLMPVIEDASGPGSVIPQIVSLFIILMTSYIFGVVTAFTLLDDRDDAVLMSLKITPVSVRFYVFIKLVISYIFGVLATLLLVYATDFLPGESFGDILMISLVAALQGPVIALIVNSFAKNKVEGFVIMKLSGLILMIPVLVFWVFDWKEVFLVFSPGFWPARMVQMLMLPQLAVNFKFIVYFLVGMGYNILFSYLLFKLYSKKANI